MLDYFTPENISSWSAKTQCLSILHDAHFAVFNQAEASRGRKRNSLLKALGHIHRAFIHVRDTN